MNLVPSQKPTSISFSSQILFLPVIVIDAIFNVNSSYYNFSLKTIICLLIL